MNTGIPGDYKERKYFSTTRNYTLSLLNAFNNVKYWVEGTTQKEYTLPISFGNYEKSIVLKDLSETQLLQGNFNFLPRLVLSFEGMTKSPERQTNKFQKLTKRVFLPEDSSIKLDTAYNSVAYDYHFTLLLQTRGLTIASQVTEEILTKFNPSLNLEIYEFPIFNEPTETQILITDPAFEIMDEFNEEEVNIVTVTFDITVRGNVYSPIELSGGLEHIKMFTHLWEEKSIQDANLASYYKFDVAPDTNKIFRETARIFGGDQPYSPIVEEVETEVIDKRTDYSKYQSTTTFDVEEYNFNNPSPIDDNI